MYKYADIQAGSMTKKFSQFILQKRVQLTLIVLAGVIAYANSLQAPFVFDDGTIIAIGQSGFTEILLNGGSRRIVDLTFLFNYRLHGLDVAGYHITNLLIHLGGALMVYLLAETVLHAVSTRPDSSGSLVNTGVHAPADFIPLASALLFVVHPLQVQAVTYTIQRYTSLATLWYLVSCWSYLKARLNFEHNGHWRSALIPALACLASGILAIGSKQIAVTLPVMLLVLEIWLLGGRLLSRRFLAGAAGCLAIAMLGMFAAADWSLANLQQFAQTFRDDQFFPRETYLLNQTHVVARYLQLLSFPAGQSLCHAPQLNYSLTDLPVAVSLVLHTGLWVAAVGLFRVSRTGADTDSGAATLRRLISLGIVWFYLAMVVESSIIPIRHIMVEHRIYLPSVGFFLAATSALLLLAQRLRISAVRLWIVLGVTVILLTSLTVSRNRIWSDTLTLWEEAVRKAPDNSLARVNLGIDYFYRSRHEDALTNLMRALELNGKLLFDTRPPLAETLQQLGVDETRYSTGKELLGEGSVKIDGELEVEVGKKYASAMTNALGIAYEYRGENEQASRSYMYALSLDPANSLAWYNLGLLAFRADDKEQAVNAFLQLNMRDPRQAERLAADMRPADTVPPSPTR
jgi:tetratricopeptide (TPR) repeat protein